MTAWYPVLVFGIEGITMFLRSTLVKSGDKKIRYWKLVENYPNFRSMRLDILFPAFFGGETWSLSLCRRVCVRKRHVV